MLPARQPHAPETGGEGRSLLDACPVHADFEGAAVEQRYGPQIRIIAEFQAPVGRYQRVQISCKAHEPDVQDRPVNEAESRFRCGNLVTSRGKQDLVIPPARPDFAVYQKTLPWSWSIQQDRLFGFGDPGGPAALDPGVISEHAGKHLQVFEGDRGLAVDSRPPARLAGKMQRIRQLHTDQQGYG